MEEVTIEQIQQKFQECATAARFLAGKLAELAAMGVKTDYVKMCEYEGLRKLEETMHRVQDISAAHAAATPEAVAAQVEKQSRDGTLKVL